MAIEGSKPFQNDDAYDWVTAMEGRDADTYVAEAFQTAVDRASTTEYLDVDDGAQVIAAAALVAAAMDGDERDISNVPDHVFEVARELAPTRELRQLALDAIDVVVRPDKSEIFDLICESEMSDDWRATVNAIRSRIAATLT